MVSQVIQTSKGQIIIIHRHFAASLLMKTIFVDERVRIAQVPFFHLHCQKCGICSFNLFLTLFGKVNVVENVVCVSSPFCLSLPLVYH